MEKSTYIMFIHWWSPSLVQRPSPSRHFLKNQMFTYSDTGVALEQHITAMRLEILEQFAETPPGSLSVSDVCFITLLVAWESRKSDFVLRSMLWNSPSNRTSGGHSVPFEILNNPVIESHQRLSPGLPTIAPPPRSTHHGMFACSSPPTSAIDGGRSLHPAQTCGP